jgi:hypothetical protein
MIRISIGCLALIAYLVCFAADTIPTALSNESTLISRIYLDSSKNIRIVYSDGKELQPPKEEDQVSCDYFAVAEDKQTAGWLVDYQNSSTSYPIPMTLVIYRSGKVIRKISNGFVIGRWYFLDKGKQVAFYTNTVHGDRAPYYELRDIQSNKAIDKWQGQLTEKSPQWARRLSLPN